MYTHTKSQADGKHLTDLELALPIARWIKSDTLLDNPLKMRFTIHNQTEKRT